MLQVYNATYAIAGRTSVTVMQKQNATQVLFAAVQMQRLDNQLHDVSGSVLINVLKLTELCLSLKFNFHHDDVHILKVDI